MQLEIYCMKPNEKRTKKKSYEHKKQRQFSSKNSAYIQAADQENFSWHQTAHKT